jgi:hypothetical protein
MATHFTAGMGALWAQVDGPNTLPVYLGCHQLGDIEEPQGDVELIYCPDPSAPNRFKVVGSVQGAAGSVTTSLTTDVTDELDYLERVLCPFPIYVHMVKAGRKDVFTNFDRTFILTGARVTSKGLTALAARTPDDNSRSEQSFDLSGEELLRFVVLTLSAQTNSEANAANDITFCNEQACRTDEDPATAVCQTGFIACDAAGAATANVLVTTNGGTWAADADPFGNDEHILAIECFELGRDTTRVVCARGVTDSANPPEIAYSDDNGGSWTLVNVGSDAGEFVASRFALYAHDRNAIWLGTDQGVIFKSEDACITWTEVEDGTGLGGQCNAIHFADENVGFAVGAGNAILRSLDGGTSWASITGATAQSAVDILCCFCLDRNRIWLGYDDGELWFAEDGGAAGNASWTQRSFTGSGAGDVMDVKFMNEHVGYILTNGATPANGLNYSHYTIDGGYTWIRMDAVSGNNGLNALYLCDLWTIFFCGEVTDGSIALIVKGSVV